MKVVAIIVGVIIMLIIMYNIAKRMVETRTGFARKMLIGREEPETLVMMERLARALCNGKIIFYPDLYKDFTIEMLMRGSEVKCAIVKSEKNIVEYDRKENKTYISNIAYTEKGARLVVLFYLFSMTYITISIATMIIAIILL